MDNFPTDPEGFQKFLQKYWDSRTQWNENFMKYCKKCRIVSAKMDHTVFEFDITEDVVDQDGHIWRGVVATVMDALMCMGYWEPYSRGIKFTGVTADMSFTFLDSAKLGDTLVFVNDTLKANEVKGFFKGEVYRKSDNVLIATGKQTVIWRLISKI